MVKNTLFRFLILLLNLLTLEAKSQSLLETVKQLQKFRKVSYTDILKMKFGYQDQFAIDTLSSTVSFVSAEPQTGGYYQVKTRKQTLLFDGKKVIRLYLPDTTYKIGNTAIVGQHARTLLYWKKQIEVYLKTPSKIKQLQDTLIGKTDCHNFLVMIEDSVIKNHRVLEFAKITTNKSTNLPVVIRISFDGISDDGAEFALIEEHQFSNYQTDQSLIDEIPEAIVPDGFKLPVQRVKPIPLAIGSKAPILSLIGANNAPFTLEQLKGKIVLINFSLLGCPHCVNAAQTLTRLYEKYKNSNVAIISIYQLRNDTREAIAQFDSKFNVKYPSYTTQDHADDIYHFYGYPSFFIIDQQGSLAQKYEGYYSSLEKELIDKIDTLK